MSNVLSSNVEAWEAITVLSVELNADDGSGQKIVTELYCTGHGGLFIKVDGKMLGKVVLVDVDQKVDTKYYLANWSEYDKEFEIILEHRFLQRMEGQEVPTKNWKLNWDKRSFSAESPDVKLFPDVSEPKHTMQILVGFGEKYGGGDIEYNIPEILFPLPISFNKYCDGKVHSRHDSNAGREVQGGKFLVSSKIPSDHIASYLRANRIVSSVTIGSDDLDQ